MLPNKITFKTYSIGCNYILTLLKFHLMAPPYIWIVVCTLQNALFDVSYKLLNMWHNKHLLNTLLCGQSFICSMLRLRFSGIGTTIIPILFIRKQVFESNLLKELVLFIWVFLELSTLYTIEKVLKNDFVCVCVLT